MKKTAFFSGTQNVFGPSYTYFEAALGSLKHKVDITECASAQLQKLIFNFRPYGQLRAVREKTSIMNYELLLFYFFI